MEVVTAHQETPFGVMRSRSVGHARPGGADVVVVPGIGVSDYLVAGVTALGTWTRAHLVELPGYSGSGEPPHEMTVTEFGEALLAWLDAAGLERTVLVGHSGGTQVAARATARHPPGVRGLVLASPSIDPRFRSPGAVLRAWYRDNQREPRHLGELHKPERQRAGMCRVIHALRAHLADRLEDVVPQVRVPVLVLYGEEDLLCTMEWARTLCALAGDGRFRTMPGAHSFPFAAPTAWSDPIRSLAEEVA
jgi:pimeloyl-ACP methyl ester carboxylesterase